MAFEKVKGQKIFSNITGQTFVFADYFTVFPGNNSMPMVYDWKQLTSATENPNGWIFNTSDGETYVLERTAFPTTEAFLSVRAIVEGQIAHHREIRYRCGPRILPLKYLYCSADVGDNAYIMKGVYSEKEINSCNISLVSTKVGRYIFLLAILIAGALFLILNQILGKTEDNWVYYAPISIFTGIIASIVVYLIIAIVARHKYAKVAKFDPALMEEITIVVTPDGFAAVESDVYTGSDLIPWKEASFFIETKSGFVIIRDNKSVFWLPRSFMTRDIQNAIGSLIAARVKQR